MYLSIQAPSSIWNGAFKNVNFIKQGGFGEVYRGIDIIDNCMYAIKKITIRMEAENTIPYARLLHKIREVRCLSILDHPNIIRYYHSWVEMDNSTTNTTQITKINNTTDDDSIGNSQSETLSKSQSCDSFLSYSYSGREPKASNTQLSLYIKMEYMQYTLSYLLKKKMLYV